MTRMPTATLKARARLDKLNTEAVTHASELRSLEEALATASERLDKAKRIEASKQDREAAKQLRETYSHFLKLAETADAALATFLAASVEMKATVDTIHALGGPSIPPNSSMFVTYFHLATDSVLMFLPWARGEYRHLPPNQRRTFADLVKGWRLAVEKDIAQRLGGTNQKERAA
jgi:hypothetical protein